ncbi:unnamed protein product [Lactuca saligna]|uniref:Uncharacterized protein n=1 Tax=Lactuca saligna TaxID=75948 RepID=A0AA35YUG2_LACSI|nr:unnamed protein product [Lactuca saligna]
MSPYVSGSSFSVEVNALMKRFKMKPLLFPLAGSVTAVFNCQGPLDAPVFVGSGVPFSYVSAHFTFNTDNCVVDLYGIRANLVDGGEIRRAGNAWICTEGKEDDTAMDLGDLNGETKLSGSFLKPRLDIKWSAPKAEGSFGDARGDIIISHESINISSSSIAFELVTCRLLGVILEESTPHELQNQATVRSSVLDVLLEITKFCDLYLMETVLDDESEKKVLIALENAGIFTSGCCQKAYIHSLFPHLTTHIWHGSQELSE